MSTVSCITETRCNDIEFIKDIVLKLALDFNTNKTVIKDNIILFYINNIDKVEFEISNEEISIYEYSLSRYLVATIDTTVSRCNTFMQLITSMISIFSKYHNKI